MTEKIPAALSERGINSVEDNLEDGQFVNCGHLLFIHFEKEFKEHFIDQPAKEINK
jgi:hypothetical protein